MSTLAIIGAGGWGTALAVTLARNVDRVNLWVFEPDIAERLRRTRINEVYLPDITIPPNVAPSADLASTLQGAEIVLIAVPSPHLRRVCEQMLPIVSAQQIFVSAVKGLEYGGREDGTLLRMSEVVREVFRPHFMPRIAVLSGPTFAREVARGTPTAVVMASEDEDLAMELQRRFSTATFRLYTNTDVIGVELGAAVKNVMAIAAGICEGLELGSNAVAAVITRGLGEITRLACACGARRETLSGLAGLGDLVLTCTGAQSRNHWAGVELGRGRSLDDIVGSTRMVIEGVHATDATLELARRHNVQMPIVEQVHAILRQGRSPRDAARELMERHLKPE
ncbi:MAG: NAD(P)-dependent glycerol-3-phosphate dehydrogenase [Acidobacteria bacterium]|nr:NAD(P)-dependent glycerol-3-phosphate dehydrogenase [Acidobacteriota bacterium]